MKKVMRMTMAVVFIVIMLLGIAAFMFLKNFDLNSYKDQFAREIGNKLKTDVSIGHIDFEFGFKKGVVIDVEDILMADKGLLSGINVDVEEMQLAVDVKKFLRDSEFVITEIELREPIVRLDFSKRMREGRELENNFSSGAVKPSSDEVKKDLLRLSIHNFEITDGEIVFVADGEKILQDVELKDVDVTLSNFMLVNSDRQAGLDHIDPFLFAMSFDALGAVKILSVDGKGLFDAVNTQIRLDDVVIESDLSAISISIIEDSFAGATDLGLNRLGGNFFAKVSQAIIGVKATPVLLLKAELTNGLFDSALIPVPLTDINVACEYSNNNVDILDSSLSLAGGRISFKGRVDDVLKAQIYNMDVDAANVNVASLVHHLPEDINLKGTINGEASLRGAGFNLIEVLQNLTAQAQVDMDEGKIVNFNLLNYILQKISIIPNLAQRFMSSLPEEYRQKMQLNETMIEGLSVVMRLNKGVLSYDSGLISDIAELSAQGAIDRKQQLTFNGGIVLPEKLSVYLTDSVQEFSTLVDRETKKIAIPLQRYEGPVTAFKPLPDLEYLAKNLITSKVKDAARDFLGGFIGAEKSQPSGERQTEGQERAQPGEPDIVDTILDSLF